MRIREEAQKNKENGEGIAVTLPREFEDHQRTEPVDDREPRLRSDARQPQPQHDEDQKIADTEEDLHPEGRR